MKTNQEYKNLSLGVLRGNWAPAIVATLVYLAIALVATEALGSDSSTISKIIPKLAFFNGASAGLKASMGGVSFLLIVLLVGPLAIGYANAMRVYYEARNDNATSNMFGFAFTNYTHVLVTGLLMGIKIVLWSLLLVVPGIVKAFAYALTPYILVEHPEYSASQAIAKSEEMMKGHKVELFLLELSFIGWYFLSIITLGIGFLWLEPYAQCAVAAFYNDLKGGNGNPVILQD